MLKKGGNRLGNEKEVFRFDLNESLYFEKGQEVGEMTGISLDPEIAIQPFNDYVSIRGVIELRGSYQKAGLSQENDGDTLGFDDYHVRRYIENIVNVDDDQAEFTHRFPIEISVPAYRVTDMDDVTVGIESFDYEIPDQNQLKLNSTIEIYGISDESVNTFDDEHDKGPALTDRDDETFAFDMKMEKEEPEADEAIGQEDAPILPEAEDQPTEETEDGSSSAKESWKTKKSQTLAEFFAKNEKETPKYEESIDDTENMESPGESPALVELSDYQEESSEASAESPENVRYLADMFRYDEEETYSKMRLCIVQDNDTIESIAERYDISALQLMTQNRLDEEGLEEGQLLYIPYKKNP